MTTYRHTQTNKHHGGVVFHIEDSDHRRYTIDFTYHDRGWLAFRSREDRWIIAPDLTETFLAVIGEEEVATCIATAMLKS